MKKKLILASASPRRKEILEQMGLAFSICPSSGEEQLNTADPEEAVKALHPCRQREITLHLFFGDIACQSFASAVGQQDVEITPVISYKKDRLIRDIFLSDHGSRHPGKPEDDAECPLHDAQGADIPGMGIEFPDDPFHDKDGNGERQIKEKKNCDTYKSKHRITLFLRYDHGAECLPYYTIAVWKKQDNRHKF